MYLNADESLSLADCIVKSNYEKFLTDFEGLLNPTKIWKNILFSLKSSAKWRITSNIFNFSGNKL